MKYSLLTLIFLTFIACSEPKVISEPKSLPQVKQLKVAVIDTGLDLEDKRFKDILCKEGHVDFSHTGIKDTNGHGTHVTGLIKRYSNLKNYCVVILKYSNIDNYLQAIQYSSKNDFDIVNISTSGNSYIPEERQFIRESKAIYVIAAGNNRDNFNRHFPGAFYYFSNVYTIGSIDNSGHVSKTSNYGEGLNWEVGEKVSSDSLIGGETVMSGTSQATAIFTGKLINRILAGK